MASTTASVLSSVLTFKVQKDLLRNLRAALVYGDESYAESGSFDPGHDTITWANVPDLPINTTPLTEGTPPTKRALSVGTVSVSAVQYGDGVSITDLAKVKSPIDLATTAAERLGRQVKESLDQVARDTIALGGTVYYAGAGNVDRAGIAAGDKMLASELRIIRTKMEKAKIPAFADGFYRMFIHPDVEYDLRSDTATGGFLDVSKYTDGLAQNIVRGEIGRYEGFRFMKAINAPTFASTVTVYASIAVGAVKGWGCGDLQTLRTYHVMPGGDHSDFLAQEEILGWKVAWGCAVLSNAYFFRVESAATAV